MELCAHWTGHGCACNLLDIEPAEPSFIDEVLTNISEALATTWPFSWLNTMLGGPLSDQTDRKAS